MEQSTDLSLPRPQPGKEPMKANLFDMARRGNTQLLPLFPYVGPGDIVPCCAAHEHDGAPHAVGYFIHFNTVDEVCVNFGAAGLWQSGEVFVGQRTHGVGGETSTPFFSVQTITQRNLEDGEQLEAIAFQCEKCNAELYRHDYGQDLEEEGLLLPTTMGSLQAALAWNNSEELRHCKACGHQNLPFPLPIWGWGQHVRLSRISERGRKALLEATR